MFTSWVQTKPNGVDCSAGFCWLRELAFFNVSMTTLKFQMGNYKLRMKFHFKLGSNLYSVNKKILCKIKLFTDWFEMGHFSMATWSATQTKQLITYMMIWKRLIIAVTKNTTCYKVSLLVFFAICLAKTQNICVVYIVERTSEP
jgi:hypothetical protein